MDNTPQKKRVLYGTFGIVSLVFFSIVLIIKSISPFMYLSRKYAIITVIIVFALFIFMFCFQRKIGSFFQSIIIAIDSLSYIKLLATIFILSFFPKLICGLLMGIDSRNVNIDIFVYQNIAYELSTNGIVTTYADYCNSFPHLLWFGLFLAPVVKLFGTNQIALCVFFDILLTLTSLLLFCVFAKNTSKTKSFFAIALFSLLPSTVLLPQFITHEIPFLFFLVLAIWIYYNKLYTKGKKLRRLVMFCLFLLSLSFAIMLNACGYIALIAFGITIIVFEKETKILKRVGKCFFMVFFVGLIIIGSTNILKPMMLNNNLVSNARVNNVQWTLFVGSNVSSSGGFTAEDQKQFAWSFNDCNTLDEKGWSDEAVISLRNNLFHDRLFSLFKEPLPTIKLLFTKFGKIWSFINYTYFAIPPLIENDENRNIYSELFMPILISIEISVSIVVLLLSIRNVRKSRYLRNNAYQFSILFMVGCTFLFLMTECNSKYTITLQPFFWMVVILNMKKPKVFDFLNHKDMKKQKLER